MPVIYKITSPSKKVYIGQSWDWVKRRSVYKRKACEYQVKLYNSLVKYGYDNHVIEVICKLPEDVEQSVLDSYEKLYLQQYKDCGVLTMNIREPGSNGKLSKETIDKIKRSLKGRIIKKESIEKGKLTKKLNGYTVSAETRQKIGNGHRGKTMSEEVKKRLREVNLGKKLSEETKEKIRKSTLGKNFSEETRKKISDSNKGDKNGMFGKLAINVKSVINIETGEVFKSITEAETMNGINKGVLVNKLNGRTKNNTPFTYYNAN